MRDRRILIALACAGLLLSAGCGTDPAPATQASDGAGEEASGIGDAGERSRGRAATKGHAGGATSSKKVETGSDAAAGPAGSTSSGAAGADDADVVALGSAEAIDDASDRTGTGPGYGEITRAAVAGNGESLTFTVEVAEAFPRRPTEQQNLIVGIGVQEDSDHGAVAVVAQGTKEGWTAVVQNEEESRPVPDWTLKGNTITWTIPWGWVGGPRPFEWGASLQLFDFSTESGTASDKAPNAGPQAFPGA